MQVSQKDAADRTGWNPSLHETDGGASPAVEEEAFATGLDQGAGAKLFQPDGRADACSEQGHSEPFGLWLSRSGNRLLQRRWSPRGRSRLREKNREASGSPGDLRNLDHV
jgi:hypothetical protein